MHIKLSAERSVAVMSVRLMDQPEDYKALGINPDHIEMWEDSRRNRNTGAGNWEWWYFDSILDNGYKAVVQFFTKAGMKKIKKDGDSPSLTVKITAPDGKLYSEELTAKPDECIYGKEKCDVHIGRNTFIGDFKEYDIHTEEKNGLGVDLHLKSLASPYRPGTAYFSFGSDEYYTWLCSVPKGEVSGTITVEGKKISVHGSGYHDHQWGNQFYLPEWNHWVWARQSFEDYSVLLFDFVTSEQYGYKRFPIIFIQNAEGKIVFESRDNVKCHVLGEYLDKKASGKYYPTGMAYEFSTGGQTVKYTIKEHDIMEAQGLKVLPLPVQLLAKKMKMNVAYSRFAATGELLMDNGSEKISRSGELINEFMYPGETFKGHM
jgi:hypothetical protein